MKFKHLLLIIATLACFASFAFMPQQDIEYIRAHSMYVPDKRGIYHEVNDTMLDKVPMKTNLVEEIAYNKKTKQLYIATDLAVCEIGLTKTGDKAAKKKKTLIKTKKSEEIMPLLKRYEDNLSYNYSRANQQREIAIEDSIYKAVQDSLRLERLKREKQIADSLAHEKLLDEYRRKHGPMDYQCKSYVQCALCDEHLKDNCYIVSLTQDTLIFAERFEPYPSFADPYIKLHATPLATVIKEENNYHNPINGDKKNSEENGSQLALHIEAYKDSLINHLKIESFSGVKDFVEFVNSQGAYESMERAIKKAPYGFVDSWSWGSPYDVVEFNVSYINTNKKTIKYIQFFFTIKNDVGDVRGSGSFKGTGPVEYLDGGTWEWDYSHYFVAGDASTMYINKIIITYMDGTKRTLSKNQIIYN